MTPIVDRAALDRHLARWQQADGNDGPIGYVLSLEGADSIVTLAHLERAYAQGLRAVGPAHYGPGVYANGTNATGDLGTRGRDLLREMERLGIILDATHLCDDSFRDALDHFRGPVWASHSNCRALVQHNRQFTDDQIKELIAARSRHRRGVRRLDARARLDPRHVHAGTRRRDARNRRRSHRPYLPVGGQCPALRDRLGSRRRIRPRAVPVGRRTRSPISRTCPGS